MLFAPSENNMGDWLWIDTERLQILSSWTDLRTGQIAIGDDKIAMPRRLSTNRCEVRIRSLRDDWRMLTSGQYLEVPRFLNEDLVFLSSKWGISLMLPDGHLLFRQRPPSEGQIFGPPLAAPNADRFVVPVLEDRGGVVALDIPGHPELDKVFIYAVSSQKQTYALDVHRVRINGPSHFALSPNGQLLAMLNYESVLLFELPPLP